MHRRPFIVSPAPVGESARQEMSPAGGITMVSALCNVMAISIAPELAIDYHLDMCIFATVSLSTARWYKTPLVVELTEGSRLCHDRDDFAAAAPRDGSNVLRSLVRGGTREVRKGHHMGMFTVVSALCNVMAISIAPELVINCYLAMCISVPVVSSTTTQPTTTPQAVALKDCRLDEASLASTTRGRQG